MEKVQYGIHHQYVVDCPKCGETLIGDLGEDDMADGIEVECHNCKAEFELEGQLD